MTPRFENPAVGQERGGPHEWAHGHDGGSSHGGLDGPSEAVEGRVDGVKGKVKEVAGAFSGPDDLRLDGQLSRTRPRSARRPRLLDAEAERPVKRRCQRGSPKGRTLTKDVSRSQVCPRRRFVVQGNESPTCGCRTTHGSQRRRTKPDRQGRGRHPCHAQSRRQPAGELGLGRTCSRHRTGTNSSAHTLPNTGRFATCAAIPASR